MGSVGPDIPKTWYWFIEYYQPVFIPILLSTLSILAGLATGRIQRDANGILKAHGDLVLGLFSFIVWAFVTYNQTGRISLNKDYLIGFFGVLVLLFMDVFVLIGGILILRAQWHDSLQRPAWIAHRKEICANGVFFAFTFLLVLLPLGFKVPVIKEDAKAGVFRVAVPYFDESLARATGFSRWGERLLCATFNVSARTAPQAIEEASKRFEDSPRSLQLLSPKGESRKVAAYLDRVVIQRE